MLLHRIFNLYSNNYYFFITTVSQSSLLTPLLKDTTWVTGKVVDYITFVKYDSKGRKMVENRLKPDGSPHGKLVYVYNPAGQVSREIYATADEGVSDCWGYTYDEKGRLNCIAYMNVQEDTL